MVLHEMAPYVSHSNHIGEICVNDKHCSTGNFCVRMLGAIFLANFSKYNAIDNVEFLESLVDEYLLIAATGQTVLRYLPSGISKISDLTYW